MRDAGADAARNADAVRHADEAPHGNNRVRVLADVRDARARSQRHHDHSDPNCSASSMTCCVHAETISIYFIRVLLSSHITRSRYLTDYCISCTYI